MPLQTSSNDVQSIIESRVEKRTKGVYVPLGGRKMVTFMDDFNMPAKDMFGSQPPLELIRLWLDYGFWYNRTKQTLTYIRVRGATFICQFTAVNLNFELYVFLFCSIQPCSLHNL